MYNLQVVECSITRMIGKNRLVLRTAFFVMPPQDLSKTPVDHFFRVSIPKQVGFVGTKNYPHNQTAQGFVDPQLMWLV